MQLGRSAPADRGPLTEQAPAAATAPRSSDRCVMLLFIVGEVPPAPQGEEVHKGGVGNKRTAAEQQDDVLCADSRCPCLRLDGEH